MKRPNATAWISACMGRPSHDAPNYPLCPETLLGEYLKQYCTAIGVTYISDDVVDVTFDERGYVGALELREPANYSLRV